MTDETPALKKSKTAKEIRFEIIDAGDSKFSLRVTCVGHDNSSFVGSLPLSMTEETFTAALTHAKDAQKKAETELQALKNAPKKGCANCQHEPHDTRGCFEDSCDCKEPVIVYACHRCGFFEKDGQCMCYTR